MKPHPHPAARQRRTLPRGLTLMEVVIAIAVMAISVPLVFTATTSANSSRRSAEADTRSVWLARETQREIITKWSDEPSISGQSIITTPFGFPQNSPTGEASGDGPGPFTKVLIFGNEGAFISEGSTQDLDAPSLIPGATYLLALHAEPYTPPGIAPTASQPALAKVTIDVLSPATAPPGTPSIDGRPGEPGKRSLHRYTFITTRQGLL